jgi:quinol monooxygenase YgiN
MATLVILELKAKTEHIEAVKSFLNARLPETRAYKGCQSITAYVNTDDGRTVVAVEHWDTQEAYQKYLAWRTETGVMAQLADMIEGSPSIRFFEAIKA